MQVCLGNLLEFSDYYYSHLKYEVNPSCRDSTTRDSIDQLETIVCQEWHFDFEGVFAKAFTIQGFPNFYYVDQKVVDEYHLGLENLIQIYNGRKKSFFGNSAQIDVNWFGFTGS
ncbi:MAG: hypothetical protein KJ879_00215 [Nanoarchaeota archaeon]|nr:hypothetical protein [Nanoarchaeota archaeon]